MANDIASSVAKESMDKLMRYAQYTNNIFQKIIHGRTIGFQLAASLLDELARKKFLKEELIQIPMNSQCLSAAKDALSTNGMKWISVYEKGENEKGRAIMYPYLLVRKKDKENVYAVLNQRFREEGYLASSLEGLRKNGEELQSVGLPDGAQEIFRDYCTVLKIPHSLEIEKSVVYRAEDIDKVHLAMAMTKMELSGPDGGVIQNNASIREQQLDQALGYISRGESFHFCNYKTDYRLQVEPMEGKNKFRVHEITSVGENAYSKLRIMTRAQLETLLVQSDQIGFDRPFTVKNYQDYLAEKEHASFPITFGYQEFDKVTAAARESKIKLRKQAITYMAKEHNLKIPKYLLLKDVNTKKILNQLHTGLEPPALKCIQTVHISPRILYEQDIQKYKWQHEQDKTWNRNARTVRAETAKEQIKRPSVVQGERLKDRDTYWNQVNAYMQNLFTGGERRVQEVEKAYRKPEQKVKDPFVNWEIHSER